MIKTQFIAAAFILTAACSQSDQSSAGPANEVAAAPVAPAAKAKAKVAPLKGSWKVTGASGLTATFSGAQASLASGCLRRAWTYSQNGSAVAFKPGPGGSNCGRTATSEQEAAFSTFGDTNLAVFGADGRTVMLSGLGGTLQLERR